MVENLLVWLLGPHVTGVLALLFVVTFIAWMVIWGFSFLNRPD